MSKEHSQLIDTRQATVERVSPELIEVRFKPDVKLDAAGIGEVMNAKRTLGQDKEYDVLAVLPAEMDLEINVVSMDHHALNGGCSGSRRLAFAALCGMNQKLAEIYFRYHPRPHETAVFASEGDARDWLNEQPALN
ncbi:MAG: hypothetical protein WEC15_05375 [Flavobacteriales bacterium]